MIIIHHKEVIEVTTNLFSRLHICMHIEIRHVIKKHMTMRKHSHLNLCRKFKFCSNSFSLLCNIGYIGNIIYGIILHFINGGCQSSDFLNITDILIKRLFTFGILICKSFSFQREISDWIYQLSSYKSGYGNHIYNNKDCTKCTYALNETSSHGS